MTPFDLSNNPRTLLSTNEESNENLVNEVSLAGEILDFANDKKVNLIFPDDYKCADEFKSPTFFVESDFSLILVHAFSNNVFLMFKYVSTMF